MINAKYCTSDAKSQGGADWFTSIFFFEKIMHVINDIFTSTNFL
jgi:hypothetical protein